MTYGLGSTRATTTGIPCRWKFWMTATWSGGRYGCSLTQLVPWVYDASPTATTASFGAGPLSWYTFTPAVAARARTASTMFFDPWLSWK
jgi:hypothetical protein